MLQDHSDIHVPSSSPCYFYSFELTPNLPLYLSSVNFLGHFLYLLQPQGLSDLLRGHYIFYKDPEEHWVGTLHSAKLTTLVVAICSEKDL